MIYSTKQIKEAYARKGYRFFDKGKYNLNIFGIRSTTSESNKFDDLGGVIYKDAYGVERLFTFPITTDPGKYYLLKPLNKFGTAIIVPGQYLQCYTIGIHGRSHPSGGYTALEQVANMKYVRDNSMDTKLNFELYKNPKNIFEANLKTNIHRANAGVVSSLIGRYSAGCQVLQNPDDFNRLIELCRDAIRNGHRNRFSYTLFEEGDLI